MKLQNPPRTHPSPLFSRQHASRKSVTGDSSQYMGRAAYHREFSASQACCAESSYLNRAYTFPIRSDILRKTKLQLLAQSMENPAWAKKAYGHCYYRTLRPLQVRHICTFHTRNLHRRHRSGFAAGSGSFYSWCHMPGFGTDLAGGSSASMKALRAFANTDHHGGRHRFCSRKSS